MDTLLSMPLSHTLTVMSTMLLEAENQGEALQECLHRVHAPCRRLAELKCKLCQRLQRQHPHTPTMQWAQAEPCSHRYADVSSALPAQHLTHVHKWILDLSSC